jgi:multiple sugar transport system permease protein
MQTIHNSPKPGKIISHSEAARRQHIRNEFVFGLAFAGSLVMLLPFAWMLSTSLKSPAEIFVYPLIWIPKQPAWDNYPQAFHAAGFGRLYLNSLFVAISSTSLSLLTSSAAAYAFARLKFRGRDTIFILYLATMMIPGQVTLIPTFIIIRVLGWYNTYQALIFPSIVSAFGTFLLRQYFRSIPMELDEAARIDGAGSLRIWWQIAMPLATPALTTVAILGFLGNWNEFLWPLIVTNTKEMWTIPLGLTAFQGQYNVQWHLLMAGTAIAILPTLALYAIGQKKIVGTTTIASGGHA